MVAADILAELDGEALEARWSFEVICLSYIVSVVGVMTAMSLNEARRVERSPQRKFILLLSVAMTLGGIGVFLMHFTVQIHVLMLLCLFASDSALYVCMCACVHVYVCVFKYRAWVQ